MKRRSATARGLTAALVIASLGCSDQATSGLPPGSVPQPPSPAAPPTPAPPPFPQVSNASAIYLGPENLYDQFKSYHGSSLPTRFVLFDDSTFYLQFASLRFGLLTYAGRYSRSDATFRFNWVNESGPTWNAQGTQRGDTLDIRYGENMVMSDFIDGAYVLVRCPPMCL